MPLATSWFITTGSTRASSSSVQWVSSWAFMALLAGGAGEDRGRRMTRSQRIASAKLGKIRGVDRRAEVTAAGSLWPQAVVAGIRPFPNGTGGEKRETRNDSLHRSPMELPLDY